MIATALRLHATLTEARAALTVANLAAMEAFNNDDTQNARIHRAQANGLRTRVGKCASEFRAARDKAVYLHGHAAAEALRGLE